MKLTWQISVHTLQWEMGHGGDILEHIGRIIDHAAALSSASINGDPTVVEEAKPRWSQ